MIEGNNMLTKKHYQIPRLEYRRSSWNSCSSDKPYNGVPTDKEIELLLSSKRTNKGGQRIYKRKQGGTMIYHTDDSGILGYDLIIIACLAGNGFTSNRYEDCYRVIKEEVK